MREQLVIKIRSLACEQTIIRRREQRLKQAARRARIYIARANAGDIDATPQQRGIALDVEAARTADFWSLRTHRQGLKAESRAALLAYAFLRGDSYENAERYTRKPVDFASVERVARKFGVSSFRAEAFASWRDAALAHLEASERAASRQTEAALSATG